MADNRYKKAVNNLKVDDSLQKEKKKKEITKNGSLPVSIRLPIDIIQELDEKCTLLDRSRGYFIKNLLEKYSNDLLKEMKGERNGR